jgi:hypothetical protein
MIEEKTCTGRGEIDHELGYDQFLSKEFVESVLDWSPGHPLYSIGGETFLFSEGMSQILLIYARSIADMPGKSDTENSIEIEGLGDSPGHCSRMQKR